MNGEIGAAYSDRFRPWRHWLLVAAFVVAVAILMGRVVYLNLSHRAFLQYQGDARTVRSEIIRTHPYTRKA